ncbi:MAG: bifunctional glutamate N-acetyltransferase/amino-acid acetyltransferase ArgJ [Bacillota bacterium]|nr:bifunctional glutamate N-acetyltransferase/amino-acid acetyltransferase ArgJ [Bacillota bacterium]
MFKQIEKGVCAPQGFLANGVHCGVRKNKSKKDLSLIFSKEECAAAAIYTQNKVKGAPIAVTKAHLEDGKAHAMLCNSGNANTCNLDGEEIAEKMCQIAADALNISAKDIIIASTGVIGQPLPIEPIQKGMPELVAGLNENGSFDAVTGIMTTDTFQKEVAIEFELGGKVCKMGGIAKGSGMIHPNMATMLVFVTSDVSIDSSVLAPALKEVADETFNMISVDGDTSTNDTLSIMCNGLAGNEKIMGAGQDLDTFKEALRQVCATLCRMLAKDGEGATKLLTCKVNNARSQKDARAVAKSIICSSLFKAAMFGNDANWGRVLCAIGYADAEYEVDKIDVAFQSNKGYIQVCENGRGCNDGSETGIDEEKALAILKEDEIEILVDLHDGEFNATAWGCDLTYDYVKINGDYRT